MWGDFANNGADFSAGAAVDESRRQHERLRKDADSFGFRNPEAVARDLGFGDTTVEGRILEEDEEDDFLSEIMRQAGECRIRKRDAGGTREAKDAEWFPYPSKMMFLLDTLDNLPRLRVSGSLMRVFLWILKEARCKDVPSFDHLRRVQKSIRSECGIPSIPCKSVQGNVFFMNDPAAIIAQDWANPTTRKLIHVYPEIPKDGVIREIWHARKWRTNMDLDTLSPMYDAGDRHYYVNEVLRLKNDLFVIPIRWVILIEMIQGEAVVLDSEVSLICSDDFQDNYLDLEYGGKTPKWAESTIETGHSTRMPNPKRIIAGGDPLYCSMVDYFGDDVSGNRTKSWNKHWNAYMTHRNLPRQLLQQEFHVHFISTSPKASITEQYGEFKLRVEATHTAPVKVRDETGATTRFCIHTNSGPSDNPMQSEISAHIGGKGNHFCRKCKVGGTQQEKATDEGYHALFEPGEPRAKEEILTELEKQVELACSGVAKRVSDTQTATGVKDMYTQYWIEQLIARFHEMKKDEPTRSTAEIEQELIEWTHANKDTIYSGFLTTKGFDPTRDTPVELLHTILLGVVKYIWHASHTSWSDQQKKTYALRLQSTNIDGLSIHPIRSNYIMQYAGSLIGRQFKTIVQTNIFHVHGIVPDLKFMAWKAAGELSALLWVPEIRNLDEYRRDLKVAVANVLDIFAMIDPSKMVTKIKYHLLAHLDEDTVDFGPLIGVMTEVFECFNAIFRFCSILSNHLAPSRDIAIQLGDQEGLKHRLTGGWWEHGTNDWHRAGPGVRHFMAKHPLLQRLLGWTEKETLLHGMMISLSIPQVPLARVQQVRASYELRETSAARALNFGMYSPESSWTKCVYVASKSLEKCFIGSWVFAESATDTNSTVCGRISDILCNQDSDALVVLELFQVLSTRDERIGMPILVRRDSEVVFSIFPAKKIQFKFNAQHDCYTAKCEATGVRLQVQERVESDRIENFIVHNALDRYIINSHAFHNAHLLRATLPRSIIAPIPYFPDREAHHTEMAVALRASREVKRAKAAASKKRKAHDNDGEVGEEPQKKRKKATKKNKGKKPQQQHSFSPHEGTMVSARGKRTVKLSAKAKAAAAAESDEDDESETVGSEDQDFYSDSRSDCSDY
ncbi:hypothetical protein B0H19DRAFT_934723 [Mycena capillaripes]|nr:hypothetical protein B0H19DRAFT_972371 [Mycena capillaripes]KAJ6574490.1 hypothetical protein B0H19DRAFT_934723 [Mycena capillaripes]